MEYTVKFINVVCLLDYRLKSFHMFDILYTWAEKMPAIYLYSAFIYDHLNCAKMQHISLEFALNGLIGKRCM